ncbi:MAG: hypothetical protein JWQ24_1561 [Tardiphaga sp.]|nr:hypothetical protein [Tardiphaga sp.]
MLKQPMRRARHRTLQSIIRDCGHLGANAWPQSESIDFELTKREVNMLKIIR